MRSVHRFYRPKPVRVILPSTVSDRELGEMREDALEAARLGRSAEWIASRLGVSVEIVRQWVERRSA